MEGYSKSDGAGTMDRLVSELTLEERQNLLTKLKGQSGISSESLYQAVEHEEIQENFEVAYVKLPWYYRLYYFILGFFKSLPPVKLYENSQIGKIGREIDIAAPGLYDYQRNYMLSDFYKHLVLLKDSARFFYSSLEKSVNFDKGNFYSFLGSLEMGDTHNLLLKGTDPDAVAAEMPSAGGQEVKQKVYKNMEDALSAITEEQRNLMYFNARSLQCLKELSSFMFDRIIMAFGASGADQTCSANIIKDQLNTLNNILYSLSVPPSMSLLESLFLFSLQERSGERDFNISHELRTMLNKAENAIDTIRSFNKQVPLTRILRCVYRNLSLSPQQISGGEDWFSLYRDYWKRQIDYKYSEYIQIRRHNELSQSFRYFLKGTNFKIIENVISDARPDGLPIPEAFTLSFLLAFYSAVFMADINNKLRPVLIDGEFLKKENRTEFTEAFNDIIKLEDDIKHFEQEISPSGDFGKRYSMAKQDISSLPVKRRKVQIILEDASRMAAGIIERTRTAMRTMVNILNGIIKKDPVGRYEGLANMNQLAGKTQTFVNGIKDSINTFQQAVQLLDDIGTLDTSH